VTIERRGRSHKAVCICGWTSHSWNELRPAEADAWHHVYGDAVIIDVSAIPDERSLPGAPSGPGGSSGAGRGLGQVPIGRFERDLAVERLVQLARELASRPSPYTRDAAPELWRAAERNQVLVQSAITEIAELLSRHDRQSAGAADSEWLQLITAKRLLAEALTRGEDSVGAYPARR
jgi:hypothetical protein